MTEITGKLSAALADRYRIEGRLGEGGMATVYLAEDLKHNRKVALKVLRPELAAVLGAERFLQEITTTANLQHPHILPLFDSGEARVPPLHSMDRGTGGEAFLYYVMPFIDGETLRDKLNRETQLGIDEAVKITTDVADALDYAHRHGVIHRDIKPENILLHDGRPMVADFGIALAVSAAAGGRMTETGLSLGTPHYMSPEQATAEKDLTHRTDIYSLGSVLYEMLAGEPPHTGASAQAIVMKIVTDTPRPVVELRKSVPPNVAAAVAMALEKVPADRFETAKAFRSALETPSFTHRTTGYVGANPTAASARPGRAAASGWIVAAVASAVAIWSLAGTSNNPVLSGPPSLAFHVDSIAGVRSVAVTDDGWLVTTVGGEILVRAPDVLEFEVLHTPPAPNRVEAVATSPDGRSILFTTLGATQNPMAGAGLYRMPREGGVVVPLWRQPGRAPLSPVWSEDGRIYFTHSDFADTGTLVRMPEEGGEVDSLFSGRLFPTALVPGNGLILTNGPLGGENSRLVFMNLNTRDTTTILQPASWARWSPTGHLVYNSPSGSLWAIAFDPASSTVTGRPVHVLPDATNLPALRPTFHLSTNGTLAYHRGAIAPLRFELLWLGLDGSVEQLPIHTVSGGSLSPAGSHIGYHRNGELHVIDLDLGTDVLVLNNTEGTEAPVWSPEGNRLAFRGTVGGRAGVWTVAADGSDPPQLIQDFSELPSSGPVQWLADGTLLLNTNGDVRTLNAEPDSPPRDGLVADWPETGASVSPDGRWIAYASFEDGWFRGYLRSWPDLTDKVVFSGPDTLWAPDGLYWTADSRGLYYTTRSGGSQRTMMEVRFDDGNGTPTSRRRVITTLGHFSDKIGMFGIVWDLHPDQTRFLATRRIGDGEEDGQAESPPRLVVVTNWFTDLQRKMAATIGN